MKRRDAYFKSSTDPDFEEGITQDVMFVSENLTLEVYDDQAASEWTFRAVTEITDDGIPVVDMSTSPSFYSYLPFALKDVDPEWLFDEKTSFMEVIRKYLKSPER